MFVNVLTVCLLFVGVTLAHDQYMGKCPDFPSMQGFNWDEFREGRWYAMEKFGTTQSKCFTYDFDEDEDGFKVLEQNSVLKGLKRFSVNNKYRYKGKLAAPQTADPARMIVRFPLNIIGESSFVVMDTDYDNYALVCGCQDQSIVFEFLTFHSRSCTILQREPIWDPSVSTRLHDFLNEKVVTGDDEKPDHDFDRVDHSNCNYADDGKGLQIDVDKILGIGKGPRTPISGVVEDIAGEIFGDNNNEEITEGEITRSNSPLKQEKPRI